MCSVLPPAPLSVLDRPTLPPLNQALQDQILQQLPLLQCSAELHLAGEGCSRRQAGGVR